MLLTEEQKALFSGDRNAIRWDQWRWPDGVVAVEIDKAIPVNEYNLIVRAFQHIMSKTCIKIGGRTTQRKYARIFKGEGCYASVGMSRPGEHEVSLGDGCMFFSTVVHELVHLLGFFHEHARSDRDSYITILWDNIQDGWSDQFNKLDPDQERLYDKFDFKSVMLYGSDEAAKPGKYTMVRKSDGKPFSGPPPEGELAKSDIYRINKLYQCVGKY